MAYLSIYLHVSNYVVICSQVGPNTLPIRIMIGPCIKLPIAPRITKPGIENWP